MAKYRTTIEIDVNVDGIQEIRAVKAGMEGVERSGRRAAKGVSSSMDKTSKTLRNLRNQILATAAAWGAWRVASNVVEIAADFEQAMAKAASVAGAMADELEQMTMQARLFGRETTFLASQSADAFYSLASAGLSAKESMDSLAGTMLLAGATGEKVGDAAERVTAVMRAFRMEAVETNRIANVMAETIASSPATLTRLGLAFKYTAGLTKSFGWQIEDTAAALGLLHRAGFFGEMAGVALRAALVRLVRPMNMTREGLRDLGLTASEVNPELHDMGELLDTFAEKMDIAANSTKPFKQQVLDVNNAMFSMTKIVGQEALPGMLALIMQGGDEWRKFRDQLYGTKKAGEQFVMMMNTMKSQFIILKSAMQEWAIAVVTPLSDALKALTAAVADQVKSMSERIDQDANNIKRTFRQFVVDAIKWSGDMVAATQRVLDSLAPIASAFFTILGRIYGVMTAIPKEIAAVGIIGFLMFGTKGRIMILAALGWVKMLDDLLGDFGTSMKEILSDSSKVNDNWKAAQNNVTIVMKVLKEDSSDVLSQLHDMVGFSKEFGTTWKDLLDVLSADPANLAETLPERLKKQFIDSAGSVEAGYKKTIKIVRASLIKLGDDGDEIASKLKTTLARGGREGPLEWLKQALKDTEVSVQEYLDPKKFLARIENIKNILQDTSMVLPPNVFRSVSLQISGAGRKFRQEIKAAAEEYKTGILEKGETEEQAAKAYRDAVLKATDDYQKAYEAAQSQYAESLEEVVNVEKARVQASITELKALVARGQIDADKAEEQLERKQKRLENLAKILDPRRMSAEFMFKFPPARASQAAFVDPDAERAFKDYAEQVRRTVQLTQASVDEISNLQARYKIAEWLGMGAEAAELFGKDLSSLSGILASVVPEEARKEIIELFENLQKIEQLKLDKAVSKQADALTLEAQLLGAVGVEMYKLQAAQWLMNRGIEEGTALYDQYIAAMSRVMEHQDEINFRKSAQNLMMPQLDRTAFGNAYMEVIKRYRGLLEKATSEEEKAQLGAELFGELSALSAQFREDELQKWEEYASAWRDIFMGPTSEYEQMFGDLGDVSSKYFDNERKKAAAQAKYMQKMAKERIKDEKALAKILADIEKWKINQERKIARDERSKKLKDTKTLVQAEHQIILEDTKRFSELDLETRMNYEKQALTEIGLNSDAMVAIRRQQLDLMVEAMQSAGVEEAAIQEWRLQKERELDAEIWATRTKHTQDLLNATSNLFGAMQGLFAEHTAANKAFAVGSIITDTATGIMKAFQLPYPMNWMQAAAVAITGATQLAKIGGSGDTSVGGKAPPDIPPSDTFVGDVGATSLRAMAVEQDDRLSQELFRLRVAISELSTVMERNTRLWGAWFSGQPTAGSTLGGPTGLPGTMSTRATNPLRMGSDVFRDASDVFDEIFDKLLIPDWLDFLNIMEWSTKLVGSSLGGLDKALTGGKMKLKTQILRGVHEMAYQFGEQFYVEMYQQAKSGKNIFGSRKTKWRTDTLDGGFQQQFNEALRSMEEMLTEAGRTLGIDVQDFLGDFTRSMSINIKGLDADSITKVMAEWFGDTFNLAVEHLFSDIGLSIDRFKKEGEEASETFIRLATDVASVEFAFRQIGVSLDNIIPALQGLDSVDSGTRAANLIQFTSDLIGNLGGDLDSALSVIAGFSDAVYSEFDALRINMEIGVSAVTGILEQAGVELTTVTAENFRKAWEAASQSGLSVEAAALWMQAGNALSVYLDLQQDYNDKIREYQDIIDETKVSKAVRDYEKIVRRYEDALSKMVDGTREKALVFEAYVSEFVGLQQDIADSVDGILRPFEDYLQFGGGDSMARDIRDTYMEAEAAIRDLQDLNAATTENILLVQKARDRKILDIQKGYFDKLEDITKSALSDLLDSLSGLWDRMQGWYQLVLGDDLYASTQRTSLQGRLQSANFASTEDYLEGFGQWLDLYIDYTQKQIDALKENAEASREASLQIADTIRTMSLDQALAPSVSAEGYWAEYRRLAEQAAGGDADAKQAFADFVSSQFLPFMRTFMGSDAGSYQALFRDVVDELKNIGGLDENLKLISDPTVNALEQQTAILEDGNNLIRDLLDTMAKNTGIQTEYVTELKGGFGAMTELLAQARTELAAISANTGTEGILSSDSPLSILSDATVTQMIMDRTERNPFHRIITALNTSNNLSLMDQLTSMETQEAQAWNAMLDAQALVNREEQETQSILASIAEVQDRLASYAATGVEDMQAYREELANIPTGRSGEWMGLGGGLRGLSQDTLLSNISKFAAEAATNLGYTRDSQFYADMVNALKAAMFESFGGRWSVDDAKSISLEVIDQYIQKQQVLASQEGDAYKRDTELLANLMAQLAVQQGQGIGSEAWARQEYEASVESWNIVHASAEELRDVLREVHGFVIDELKWIAGNKVQTGLTSSVTLPSAASGAWDTSALGGMRGIKGDGRSDGFLAVLHPNEMVISERHAGKVRELMRLYGLSDDYGVPSYAFGTWDTSGSFPTSSPASLLSYSGPSAEAIGSAVARNLAMFQSGDGSTVVKVYLGSDEVTDMIVDRVKYALRSDGDFVDSVRRV